MQTSGFTLMELLVVMTIIVIMAGLTMAGLGVMNQQKRALGAVTSARQVVAAYNQTAVDNNGVYMPAFDLTATTVVKPDGSTVSMKAARERWVFRLAPYLNWELEPTVFTPQIIQYAKDNPAIGMDYTLSISPRFGINDQNLGGTMPSSGVMDESALEQVAIRPTELTSTPIIAFVSSSCEYQGDGGFPGYLKVRGPRENRKPFWGNKTWTPKSRAEEFGYIDASFSGKAVCAFTDGTVRMLDMVELKDMRLWNKNAAALNEATY